MSCTNTPTNTQAENSEDNCSAKEDDIHINYIPTDSSRDSDSKKQEIESDKAVFHDYFSNKNDTDSVNVIQESDRDYKSVTDVVSRDCGEPLTSQFLRIDFNPIEGVDDDTFIQNKCVAFWKFIDDHPELNSLKVKSEKDSFVTDSYMTPPETVSSSTSSESSDGMELTPITVMALNWLKNEEVMTDALATKAAPQPCEPISKDDKYRHKNKMYDWPTGRQDDDLKLNRAPLLGSRTGSRSHTQLSSKTSYADNLTHMIAEMHNWDLEHPKSMQPPKNLPGLTIDKSNRKRRMLPYIVTNEDKYCEKCLN